MNLLYQGLRGMDPKTFEQFCFQLLDDKFPGAGLQHVDGASGDGGLDLFSGDLGGAVTIWQCKCFPDGVGESQKGQIRESFNRALQRYSPRRWILCLSVDMDEKAHRWFQRYKASHASQVTIDLFSASDIVHDLLYRRTLRNAYFPGAVIDVDELKRLVARSGDKTTEELLAIAENDLADFRCRLTDSDARFDYEIYSPGEQGGMTMSGRPGLVASATIGGMVVNAYPRDLQALQLDPPSFTVELTQAGGAKLMETLHTGRPQRFQPEEFRLAQSTFPLAAQVIMSAQEGGTLMELTPRVPHVSIHTRVRFSGEAGEVEYRHMEVSLVRIGSEELEIVAGSTSLPFRLFLVSRRGQSAGRFRIEEDFVGIPVRSLEKYVRAITVLRHGGRVEIYDLDREAEIVSVDVNLPSETEQERRFAEFVDDLVEIENRFGPGLLWPREISQSDMDSFRTLRRFVRGESIELSRIDFGLLKSQENSDMVPGVIRDGAGALMLRLDGIQPVPTLFGAEVNTGPCVFVIETYHWESPDQVIEAFSQAGIGEAVRIGVVPDSPVICSAAR